MSLPRRHWLIGSAAIAASLPALSWGASPIRLLVGFPPGGGTDAIARLLADKLRTGSAPPWWWRTAPAPAARSRPRP